MKTSRIAFIFTLLVITFTLLTAAALANSNKSRTEQTTAIEVATNCTQQTIATTEQNGAFRPTKLYAFTQDNRALRSTPFAVPEATQYVVSVSHGFESVIRKARIKRKGNVQG